MISLLLSIIAFLLLLISFLYVRRKNYKIQNGTEVGNSISKKLNNKFSIIDNGDFWNPEGRNWKNKKSIDYANAWKKFKPEIKKIFEESNIKENKDFNNKAVIHFRCSDVPFNSHPNYNLLTKEYFFFALEKIEKENIDEIIFVNCSDWHAKFGSNSEEKCNSYIETISNWLEEKTKIKINRKKYCVSVEETYGIMLGSKILIGTGGSFSFMAGILKDKNFVTPSNIGEGNLELFEKFKNLHKEVHWTMWDKFDRISHNNIDYEKFDYNNYEVNSSFKVKIN